MNVFDSILFPVDFSPRCEAAIPFVKEMVRHSRSKLTLLHVVQVPIDFYAGVAPSLHMPWEEIEARHKLAAACLGGFVNCHFADLAQEGPVEAVCERGEPGGAIVAHAQSRGCDLIMMPTHGNGPFRGMFLGSVTARVLHHAECAVWTDAHIETGLSAEYLEVRKILCAVNRAREAAALTKEAVALAQDYGAEVELVHAVADGEEGAAREAIEALQRETGTELKVHLATGSVREVIRGAALGIAADLVMIGRGRVRKPFSRLRSHAYSVIQDSPCPVLSC